VNSYRLPPIIQNQIDVMRDKLMGMYAMHYLGRAEADAQRLQTVNHLQEYFEAVARSHTDATDTIHRCWREGSGFCLYLRSFALGARSHEHAPSYELLSDEARSGMDFWTYYTMSGTNRTVISTSDMRTQKVLAEILLGELPLVSISNPDDCIVPSLPTLVLPYDGWASTVRELIGAARLVVVYCAAESRGLSQELLAIREKKRESSTIVLRHAKGKHEGLLGAISRMGRPLTPPDADLTGFDCVFDLTENWSESESERKRLGRVLRERARERTVNAFASPPLPLERPSLAPDVCERKKAKINEVFEEALRAGREGDLLEAELLLFEALATTFEIGDERIRASLLLEISHLQYTGARKFQTAIHYMGMAANLYERLGDTQMFHSALAEQALYNAALRNADESHKILRRMKNLLWGTGEWGKCLFLDLEANVEQVLGNKSASTSARAQWTRTYESYRNSGGEPQTDRAKIIALTAEIPLKAGTHYVPVWLNSEQAIAVLRNCPDLRQLMLDAALGAKGHSVLLAALRGADERWEMSRFIRLCRENYDSRA
jgi:hypothetical protein